MYYMSDKPPETTISFRTSLQRKYFLEVLTLRLGKRDVSDLITSALDGLIESELTGEERDQLLSIIKPPTEPVASPRDKRAQPKKRRGSPPADDERNQRAA